MERIQEIAQLDSVNRPYELLKYFESNELPECFAKHIEGSLPFIKKVLQGTVFTTIFENSHVIVGLLGSTIIIIKEIDDVILIRRI